MCINDGNDPDLLCWRHPPQHLRGVAHGTWYLPNYARPAWESYAHLAEAAITAVRSTDLAIPSRIHEQDELGSIGPDHWQPIDFLAINKASARSC